jgi:RNA polymerase sigma-70 factor (ECF subfamily)
MDRSHSNPGTVRPQRPIPGRSDVVAGDDAGDLALVHRAQRGERGAFDLLMLRYQRRIFKLTQRYTRNPYDAEDASQEAFMKAYRALRGFRGECAFYTWLHRIAINCANNILMARARDPLFSTLVVPDDDETAELTARLRELETPEDLSLTDDIRSVVNAALEALPEAHRAAIIWREIDGLTYEEIAVAMNTPVGTVRSRIFRARELIDHQLRPVFDGGLGRRVRRRSATATARSQSPQPRQSKARDGGNLQPNTPTQAAGNAGPNRSSA